MKLKMTETQRIAIEVSAELANRMSAEAKAIAERGQQLYRTAVGEVLQEHGVDPRGDAEMRFRIDIEAGTIEWGEDNGGGRQGSAEGGAGEDSRTAEAVEESVGEGGGVVARGSEAPGGTTTEGR